MQLKNFKMLVPPQQVEAKISAIAWSPTNTRLAVATFDRVVFLFDEQGERRDRFSTKPSDPKYRKYYVITGLAFSLDGAKLAVAQSDNIVFVYRIGDTWEEKKSICNKFLQRLSVTCMIWPPEQPIIMGLLDGKIRIANTKTNKSTTIYSGGSYTVSLAVSSNGKGIVSGHADGKIVRYFLDETGDGETQGTFVTHPVPPFALAWAGTSIIAAGFDRRIIIYDKNGAIQQQFDYSKDPTEKESTVAISNPSGQAVAIGSYDRIRIFNLNLRKNTWEQGPPKTIKNLFTITAMCWKTDGSKLTIGTVCGGVDQFDCCMKRKLFKHFELNYVGPSQVIVSNKKTHEKMVLKSNYGYEIEDVKVMGGDKYLVTQTSETLILASMLTQKSSEVYWQNKKVKNKIIFPNDRFCVIFGAGELFVIEYGSNEVLGSVRTELMNPYLFSVRINERTCRDASNCKRIAYLLDPKTVNLVDLVAGFTVGHYTHEVYIDWLELSENANHLLLRDRKHQLILVNTETFASFVLLPFCSFVQWIPQSDAVVSQSKDNICIWYNAEAIDQVSTVPLRGGDIIGIERQEGKTEILINKGMKTFRHPLDNGLIEFGTAMDDNDFERAVSFLETLDVAEETECMWRKLADRALAAENLLVAERCFAALGLLSKAQYLKVTRDIAEQEDDMQHFKVQARILILLGELKRAEALYLEHDAIEDAISMYTKFRMYENALEVAEAKHWSGIDGLVEEYQKWLNETGQTELLGDQRAKEGDNMAAVTLYLRARVPGKAAALALSDASLSEDRDVLEQIAEALVHAGRHEKAGDLFYRLQQNESALRCYRAGGAFQRALDLARVFFPSDVVRLEEEWGNHLSSHGQLDAAIHHFIEAGAYVKAVDAAIKACQWTKAAEVLESMEDSRSEEVIPYQLELGHHYARAREFASAERAYLNAKASKYAIEMYTNAGMWEQAHALASRSMEKDDLTEMYLEQAGHLEKNDNLKDAERLYLTVKRADLAMAMYKNHRQYRDVVRMVRSHNPELLEMTLMRIAQELECEGNLRQAEQYYMDAGEWKSAVNMYRTRDLWEEAFRVAGACKEQPELRKQVAFLWAKHLGGDSAMRLLNRLGLLDTAIDYATEHCVFDFAFELVRNCTPSKIAEVHSKYAMFLEDEGKLEDAEEEFIKAGKAREAVLMYVHNQDWAAAARVAKEHDPESVNDVLLGQARIAFGEKDFQLAESLLLRAQRPDMAVRAYRETGHWEDAMRVAHAYLPTKVQELMEDYEEEKLRMDVASTRNPANSAARSGSGCVGGGVGGVAADGPINPLLGSARQMEANGDHLKAVEQYLKITPDLLSEGDTALAHPIEACENIWVHAVNLATKFLAPENSLKVTELVGSRLTRLQRYSTAGELLLSIDRIQEAIDVFIAGEEWVKARKIARELEPQLEEYVESKYKESLKMNGQAEELVDVDVLSAIEMYAEQGRWEKCVTTADHLYQETRGEREHQLLHKYLAAFAASLIKDDRTFDALLLYKRHGAPPYVQNFNIYKRIFQEITSQRNLATVDGYSIWATLRDTLFDLFQRVTAPGASGKIQPTVTTIFERMLLVAHYYAMRSALISAKQLDLATKVSISLLRNSDIIPADKAFYEAGMQCRKMGWDNMAFVFLNRFLDLMEVIEDPDGNSDALDSTDFLGTDIPLEVPIPEKPYVTKAEHEAVREWILAISMDQKLDQVLPKDERGIYEACLRSPATGVHALPCVVTGYPVLRNGITFAADGKHSANLEDWKRLNCAASVNRNSECIDVCDFVRKWCGGIA